MTNPEEIRDKIEEFFERTCITDYVFQKENQSEALRLKKKTPVGNWAIDSVELGYFIDAEDRVVITILTNKRDEIHEFVSRFLAEHAKIIET